MQTLEHRALGCRVFVGIDDDGPRGRALLADIPELLGRHEARASRFLPESELSQLNARAGHPTALSRELCADVAAALAAAEWTGGLVTPTVLAALERAGYTQSFGGGAAPVPGTPALPAPDHRGVELDVVHCRVRLPEAVRLDLAGTLKGRIADQLAARLGTHAPSLVDAGGDIRVSGPRADGSAWGVGISDPSRPDDALCQIDLRRGAVATSGRDHRRWKTGDRWHHHLIDPRTGEPAETDVLTATVVAPSAARADVAAKVVFLLGCNAGLDWAELQGLEALVVRADGECVTTPGFEATW